MTPPVIDSSAQQPSVLTPPKSPAPANPPSTPRPVSPRHIVVHYEQGLIPSIQSMLSLIVIAIFIITFNVQPFRIPSESMESTLLVGDFLLVNKQNVATDGSGGLLPAASIHRGDIIVFHDPVDASLHLVKRVIGLPGDRIRLRDQHVYINGVALAEPYAVYRPGPPDNFRDNFPRLQNADPEINSAWWIKMRKLIDHGELVIPPASYFVLGDNRNDSEDSRYWGLVPRENIVGKPLVIYFSLDQRPGDTGAFAHTRTAIPSNESAARRLDDVIDFARWSRTLQVVR